ncbi:MAG: TauD/TfdA family dioxygenase [Acidimicrobiia bacterium]|nr:TauD/TfdA family dioxygenase [Acidimicrobiia bacterium]MDH5236470.1 TauD/TfdA family dioxygenase [Acidimicrobiia bacterium]
MTVLAEPITPTIGARVTGLDLRQPDDADIEGVLEAILEHQVLCLPDQHLDPESQLAFARRLGAIDVAAFGPKHPDNPEMTVLDQTAPRGQGADAWHTDNTYLAVPPAYTILQAVQLPPLGGDTCYADMYGAWDALSAPLRALLDGLTATHDLTKTLRQAIADGNSDADLGAMQAAFPPVHHPVARTHPETGRRALFVNGNFTTAIDGLTPTESRAVLPLLLNHVGSPPFQFRHRWSDGDLLLWDNRCVQHYAVPDYTDRRIMHRLTIAGDVPR